MSSVKSLPVLMPEVPTQRWSCHSCGVCCRDLVVHISPDDRRRLDTQGWTKELAGTPPYIRLGRSWALNKREDGACVFLTPENRCLIHERFGAAGKPVACRLFPFSLHRVERGWQGSLRFDCPSAARSQGQPLNRMRSELRRLAAMLPAASDRPVSPFTLQPGLPADPQEIEALDRHMVRWFRDESRPFPARVLGAARVTALLVDATLKKVRGARFVELLDLLFGAAGQECGPPAAPPGTRQEAMLRQVVFAHVESLSLAELRRGAGHRIMRRFRQLAAARRYRRGHGSFPPPWGLPQPVSFEAVEAVGPARDGSATLDDMMTRYVLARITGRTVYGGGYYDWPAAQGYAALWLALAAIGWLARCRAAGAARDTIEAEDVVYALGIVDRAAGRAPAPGAFAERMRIAYLVRDDGLAKLLHRFRLT